MPNTLIKVDLKTPPPQQEMIHNRWHPDIPMVAWVKPGDEFRVECVDWTGGQIANDNSANDVRDVDLTKVHYLSGPIGVEGAEPGDLLPEPKHEVTMNGVLFKVQDIKALLKRLADDPAKKKFL